MITLRVCTHRRHRWPHWICGRTHDTVFMYCDKHVVTCDHPQYDQVERTWRFRIKGRFR